MQLPSYFEILTLIALIIGPVLSVYVSRIQDDRKLETDRRMNIFRTLMATRGARINNDHVGALNLIEIDFHNDPAVIAAWKEFQKSLMVNVVIMQEEKRADFLKTQGILHTKLLEAISQSLGFNMASDDILKAGYYPQRWTNVEFQLELIRRNLINVLSGVSPIAINRHKPPIFSSLCPPAPSVKKGRVYVDESESTIIIDPPNLGQPIGTNNSVFSETPEAS